MKNLTDLAKEKDEDAIKLIQHIYTWMASTDFIEYIAQQSQSKEIKSLGYEPKHELKKLNNNFVRSCKMFNKELHKHIGIDEAAYKFGDMSEFLYELFEVALFIPEPNRLKLISQAKILTKN